MVEDLPRFIKSLVDAVNDELNNQSLETLLQAQCSGDFSKTLIDVMKGKSVEAKYDLELNTDILNAFIKIFNNEYLLSEKLFLFEDTDLRDVGHYILRYSENIFEINEELRHNKEFEKILYLSIKFADETRDFHEVRNRLKYFISLNKFVSKIEAREEIGKLVFNVFKFCHPTQYLKSNPGRNLLLEKMHEIAVPVLEAYLDYILNNEFNYEAEIYYLEKNQKFWLGIINSKFKAIQSIQSIQDKIRKIKELNESA